MILSRVTPFSLRTSTRLMLSSMALLVAVLSTSASQAQQTPDMVFEPSPGSTPAQASASASGFPQSHISGEPQPEDAGVGGIGVLGRVGHIAGHNIERSQSITYFDLSPYMFVENTYLFGDGRLFITNQGQMGGSAGAGIRQYFPRNDFILGASGWYDRDDSRGATFEQVGVSLELFSQWIDVRSNYYTGIGQRTQNLGTTIKADSAVFSGNNILYNTQTALATGTDFVDLMFTVPVPGEVAQSMNLEASAGYYRGVTPGLAINAVNGYKLRMDADFLDRVLHVSTELSQDPVFKTNLIVAADVNYRHHLEARPRFGASQFNRIAQWVRRNRNVVTINSTITNPAQAAVNPATGQPYFVYHVRNVLVPPPANFPSPTGTGALATPFQYIDEAQAAAIAAGKNGELIFVHADSVFDGNVVNKPIVLRDSELVVGEGVSQTIPVQGFAQPLKLPRATTGRNQPLFQNTLGTAVTLANNNLFAGFDINNTQGTAIFADTKSIGTVQDIRINTTTGAGADGINLVNNGGNFRLHRIDITATQGDAFVVNGGGASVIYDTGTITNTSGFSVLVENNSGNVNMDGTTTNDTGGQGVRILNSSGTTTFGILNLKTTTGLAAIDIENVSGGVSLSRDVTIDTPAGEGIRINNVRGKVGATGKVSIKSRNAIGIDVLNLIGTVGFDADVTIDTPVATETNSAGINFQGSAGILSFKNITINGSKGANGAGIHIGGALPNTSTAVFNVSGTTTITSVEGSSIQILNDSSTDVFSIIDIDSRGGHGIEIRNHQGTIDVTGLTTVGNATGSGASAIDIRNSSGRIAFANAVATATTVTAAAADAGVQILDNTGNIAFTSLSVGSNQTTAVDIERNSRIDIQGGTLVAAGARAVTMIDNKAFGVLFDAVSSDSADYGIFVENAQTLTNGLPNFNNPGSFIVTGDGATRSSGGTISNAGNAGAHFRNVKTVNLGYVSLQDNGVGVETELATFLTLQGDDVTGSASYGLDVLNSQSVLIRQQCLFDSNAGVNQVRIQADQIRNPNLPLTTLSPTEYDVSIINSTFIDSTTPALVGSGDMIYIHTNTGANNSKLVLNVLNNGSTAPGGQAGFSSNRVVSNVTANPAAINTDWNGDVTANYSGNNIALSGNSGQVGINIRSSRSSALNNVNYSQNVFNDGGGNSNIGLKMDFFGSTNLSIVNNFGSDSTGTQFVDGFTMNGVNNVLDHAIDLRFRSLDNSVDISRNRITFNSNNGTAVLFEAIRGPTTPVNMDGNTINFNNNGTFLFPATAQALVFQNVVGNIALSSAANQNNVILFRNAQFINPVSINRGVYTGTFLINGTRQP